MNVPSAACLVLLAVAAPSELRAQTTSADAPSAPAGTEGLAATSPALEHYLRDTVEGDLWKRPGLSPRDRSVVVLAAMIARGQIDGLPVEFEKALDNGVRPGEVSGILTHLAFYAGFPEAASAAAVAGEVFRRRGIGADQLPLVAPELLPQDAAAEAARERTVVEAVGPVSQGVVDYTDMLFDEIWQRPDLAPRDRSLVTVAALIVSGQTGQVGFHLGRAMDNGLTRSEVSEMLTHLAFYGGWPNVFSAVPVVRRVFDERAG